VSVTDHGIGIPEADIPTLFSRFSQRDMSSTRPFSGIGLGLFIVAEIVAAHGGSVDVTSAEGDGSTFAVRLPVAGP
jgi:signal transduction histidine kinase